MSDLGGSFSSCVNADATQRPVEGDKGVNPNWPCGWVREDSSFSDLKGTHTRVNADRVITWLKPVRDARG